MTAARVLRWLADELEAGRALIELEIVPERDVVERPRSMLDDPAARLEHDVVDLGARLRLTATTTRRPPTLRPPAPVPLEQRHERDDHGGDGPCAACQPPRPHVLEDGKLRPAVGAEEFEIGIVFDQVGHVLKNRHGAACGDRCATACRAAELDRARRST